MVIFIIYYRIVSIQNKYLEKGGGSLVNEIMMIDMLLQKYFKGWFYVNIPFTIL